ncbi:sec-independent translocase [Nonomuraea gerenzanensis]|uniref:Twin-arginine translocation protein TatB n=1 Tax=Nonomuraea gerenzanensis TaxID=93944 RepID=A0A1M4EPM4_9ACTN|nr:sec-independent translocase [Nonomuraea gerenzanensis]UBU12227.1 Sec-independent protein translocase subunit TatB [Nonomuraea gerenzanensis]SBP00755.1 Twin-arginine translocation protein TatB [Nonomuraea gerenzanensis]
MFGLGWMEIGALIVIALLVFGPERLPQAAAQAGKTLRNLRRMANNARDDLRAGLGPEFQNFDPADLNPRNFVRKHLLDDLEDDWNDNGKPRELEPVAAAPYPPEPVDELSYGELPPYDSEAT